MYQSVGGRRRILFCGVIGLSLVATRTKAGVVVLSDNRETITHYHALYWDGQQPSGPPEQFSETTTVAPFLAPFQTSTQTSSLGTDAAGGTVINANGTGSIAWSSIHSLQYQWSESWTYNKTAVTFQVTDQPETFTFHANMLLGAKATLVGPNQSTLTLGYNPYFDYGSGPYNTSGTLQLGVYTFDVETITNDTSDGYGRNHTVAPDPLSANYSTVSFGVTPEPGVGLAALSLGFLGCRRRRPRRRR